MIGGIKRFFGSRVVLMFLLVVVVQILLIYLISIGKFDFVLGKNSLRNVKYREVAGTIYSDFGSIKRDDNSWVNAKVSWQDLEPGLDKYNWSMVDKVTQNSGNRPILLTVLIKHNRLTLCSKSEEQECPPRNEQEFLNFITSLFDHTQGKILFFQIGDQLDKNNFQDGFNNYLSLIEKIDKLKGKRVIVSSQIPLSSWQDYDKYLISNSGFQVLSIGASQKVTETAESIEKFKKALKEKANNLPIWGRLDQDDVSLAQTDNLKVDTIKKSLLLFSSSVEKIFYLSEVESKVDNIGLFNKMSIIKKIDFGDVAIKVFEVTTNKYSKPIYFLWADSHKINTKLNIDPAYYNFYDFKGSKTEINSNNISSDSNGLLMLPI